MSTNEPEMLFSKLMLMGNEKDDGKKFDDLSEFKNIYLNRKQFPTKVKIWAGDVIDAIQFVYDTDQDKEKSPFFHGGPNGYLKEFGIASGDFIRKVRIKSGVYSHSMDVSQRKQVIWQIQFETMYGSVSPFYGNACGKQLPEDCEEMMVDAGGDNVICAAYGYTGKEKLALHNYIRGIGFYAMVMKNE